ncbi:MAG: hypothetical protein CMO61_06470 [Verrucomicrobiales bacterium]|jgi:hypothetical protein|nr:hypothetical protein [Verrucomicrobiales bacterium]|tara:strand:+ start:42044 stop:42526 length:483 start_codon:yes stop_codon:yes gene_type:complete
MRTLIIFKRIEIWLLLIVMIGLIVFASKTPEEIADPADLEPVVLSHESDSMAPQVPAESERDLVVVEKVDVRSAQEGRIVEVTLFGTTPKGNEVVLDDSTVIAKTEGGKPVGFFFEPFRQFGSLAGDEKSLATVKLWLAEPSQIVWLEFQGEKLKAELPE